LHEWDGTVSHLDGRTRVVALDLAGHGRSGSDRQAWTVRAFADDVRAVVGALGLKRVVLVGHSMAGAIVVEAALAMPDQVVGLVPVDTLKDVTENMTSEQRAQFFAPMHADFKAGTEKLVRRLFPRDADPSLVARVVAQETANDPTIMLPAIENNFEWPEAERVAMVKIPIVSVQGDLFPTRVEANRRIAPQFQAVVVAGTGHWPMLEKPEAFYSALDQALAQMPE
jgi:pimeloyl-ACP methyl ester carboxylesterase